MGLDEDTGGLIAVKEIQFSPEDKDELAKMQSEVRGEHGLEVTWRGVVNPTIATAAIITIFVSLPAFSLCLRIRSN